MPEAVNQKAGVIQVAEPKKQDIMTKVILWVCVYWWFYPLKFLFYTLPHKFIDRKKAAQPHAYVVNLETLTAHRAECRCVREKNIDYNKFAELNCPYQEIADLGYKPCGQCKPDRL